MIALIFSMNTEASEPTLTTQHYYELTALFERECISEDGEEVFSSKCQQLINKKIAEQHNERDKKIVALAAQSSIFQHALYVNDTQLTKKIKSEAEQELRDDVYANVLTRFYAEILSSEGHFHEAYALFERSALIENDEITHQLVAKILGEIEPRTFHDHQISHLARAVNLSTTEQRELLFRSQLYKAIKKHKGQDAADLYKQEVNETTNYTSMAQKYLKLILEDDSNRKEAPPFCQPYSFDLITTEPCQIMISGFEAGLSDTNKSAEDHLRYKKYLRSAYDALAELSLATPKELERYNELNSEQ